jgi:UDP-glucose 4-epimerase
MRILFTGATSFTGMWFIRKLAEDGHNVVAAIRRSEGVYSGLSAQRLERIAGICDFAWNLTFGTPEFLDLIARKGPFDLLCHHAAEVKDYKSPGFDVPAAVNANTHELVKVLVRLEDAGCRRIVLTGSVFEENEGAGSTPMRAFSPYGLSKTLTAAAFRQHAAQAGFALGKFVIPNPFGPYEEPRFTEYLMRCWTEHKTATVKTPRYVRDNVPVSLLASAYARFIAGLPESGYHHFNPSYYVESQGAFARRFAQEITGRLKIDAPMEFADQSEFAEPAVRINTDTLRPADFGWSEHAFWQDIACYYGERFDIALR